MTIAIVLLVIIIIIIIVVLAKLLWINNLIMTNFGLIEEDFYRVSEIERDFEVVENLHDHRFGNIALM